MHERSPESWTGGVCPLSRSIVTAFFTAVMAVVRVPQRGRPGGYKPSPTARRRPGGIAVRKKRHLCGWEFSDGLFYRPRSPGCGGGRNHLAMYLHGRRPANVYQRPRDDPATPPRRKPRRGPGTLATSRPTAPIRCGLPSTKHLWSGREGRYRSDVPRSPLTCRQPPRDHHADARGTSLPARRR